MVAAVRAHAALHVAFVTELRYLAGKSHELRDWSPFSMARVLAIFENWAVRGAADGQVILDLLASGSSAFAAIEREQPAFAEHRAHAERRTRASPDGKATYKALAALRAELSAPTDDTNQLTTPLTKEIIQVACARLVEEVRNKKKRTARYTADGKLAWGAGPRRGRTRCRRPSTTPSSARASSTWTTCRLRAAGPPCTGSQGR